MTPPRTAALVLVAMVVANTVVLALLGSWTPLSGADWEVARWAADHAGASPATVVADHATFAKLIAYGLVRVPVLHALGTPVCATLLVVLACAFSRRRLAEASWADVLDVAVLSTLLWVGQPRLGLVLCYRSYAAMFVWGGAATLGVVLPYRCGWTVRAGWIPGFAVVALAAGASAPQLAFPAIAYAACAVRRTRAGGKPVPAWMWIGLAGLVAGAALAAAQSPYIEIAKVVKRGLESNFNVLSMPLREQGQLVALVAAFALGAAAIAAVRPGALAVSARADDGPELVEVPRRIAGWAGLLVLALIGPHYSEATLLPATLLLAIAALPIVRVLARATLVRAVVVAVALGVHVLTWASGLALYADLGAQASTRLQVLTSARPGTVATVAPYSELRPGFWFFGEDWQTASTRELVARHVFGLTDIALKPSFRVLERNPGVAIALDAVTAATRDQLAAAGLPASWPHDLGVARFELEAFADRLADIAPAASARLVASGIGPPIGSAGVRRPVVVGWIDHGHAIVPKVTRSGPDPQDRYAVNFEAGFAAKYPEIWLVGEHDATQVEYADGKVMIQPMTVGRWAVVACDPHDCLAVDAFILDL